MKKRPSSMRHLDDAIRRACGGSAEEYVRTRTLIADSIVAHMLPDGVVKGGSAIKMRFGNTATRFTTDLDTATATDPDVYAERLAATLAKGWEGFTGRIVPREPAQPRGVPQEYVMRPFDVKLSYNGKPWCTVPLEVGQNEIGDAEVVDWVELEYAVDSLANMGFPALGKVPLMPLVHQVAQKIHAVTGGGDRVRDLVDLQLIAANADVDLAEVKRICVRLFAYRKSQAWPPDVVKGEGWDVLYAAQAAGLPVKPSADEAIDWTNGLIARIDGEES
ncbi:nucleotidyl transferase AbiEii/AbiGii toxin family protein [Gordonibacter massiliensis (ex Traore et al. 2017)]|uniref:Nucleotidyl transferase AbiEii/AbiGii toxin family protein n=1 Tax=Gordonibacter massiliensis (ex Traore et al. 2017) TaxID=1841863 RepID=A0A842JDC9_9ACTN|nr:nucleotidyl transferase AbiEii/AbiGii toxin family protein [Gordonibacter massiliensis (ex Traore et al. 2017)]MBC2887998.1 nucleotidyl transferase AbiEii/AbiGii toxin family protein [Gordonibacter massiliensis (ex Traore et al. 2017)]